jgi:hypothetical protein
MHTIWLATTTNSGTGTNNEAQKENEIIDPTLSRWFEWFIVVRTYTTLKPTTSTGAEVIPVEIKAPPCDGCVLTVSHSAVLNFYEERDATAHCYPEFTCKVDTTHKNTITGKDKVVTAADVGVKYRADGGCDWKTTRSGMTFESLANPVCIGISLKDKTTKRAFVL